MDHLPRAQGFVCNGPAVYRNCVQGGMAASWSEHLEGMTISLDTPEEKSQ
jgi:hypothetical protein